MKKIQIIFAIISILIIASVSIFAQNSGIGNLKVKKTDDAPDLIIGKFSFVNTNDRALRVHVQNDGKKLAGANRLLLTVGKINGVVVNRKKVFTVPPLENGKGVWLFINATSILPNNVAIKSTYFRLTIDPNQDVPESDETNNEYVHQAESQDDNSTDEPKDSDKVMEDDSTSSDETLSEDKESVDTSNEESESQEDNSTENSENPDDSVVDESENPDSLDKETKTEKEKPGSKSSKEKKVKAVSDLIDNINVLIKPYSKSKKKP